MKNGVKNGKVLGLSAVIIFMVLVGSAGAHFMWVNVGDYSPRPDSTVVMNIGWGHSFGNLVGNVLTDMNRLDHIAIIDPAGVKKKVKSLSDIEFKTENPLKSEGTYIVVAQRKEGFSSKTTSGHQMKSKKELKNVLQCSYSGGYSKAIVNVGNGGGKALSKPLGHTLEIVPLDDPSNLKPGDYMSLKVLYKGEPLSVEIYASYVGFSLDGAWAYTTKTNRDGECQIKMLHPGIWLIKVGHRVPYPDPEECDQYSYTSTLTFEIK